MIKKINLLRIVLILALAIFLLPTSANAVFYSANGLIGQSDFTSRSNNRPDPIHGLGEPGYVALDSVHNRLFVSDTGNNRVLVYNLDAQNNFTTSTPANVLGQNDLSSLQPGLTQNTFNAPRGLSYNSVSNTLYVADANNNRVLVFDVAEINNGEMATNVIGQENFTMDNAGASNQLLFSPFNVYFYEPNNALFVADTANNRVLIFDLSTLPETNAAAMMVIGQTNFTNRTVSVSANTFGGSPSGMAVNSVSNTLYVADSGGNRVLAFDLNNLPNTNATATAVIGQTNFSDFATSLSQNQINNPNGLTFNSASNTLYVADSWRRVMVFDTNNLPENNATATAVIGQADFVSLVENEISAVKTGLPVGLAFNDIGKTLFVVDNLYNRLLVFDTNNLPESNATATEVVGQLNFAGGGYNMASPKPNSLYSPRYSALDSAHHRLFVGDTYNNRVLVYQLDDSDNIVSDVAVHVLGQPDFYSNVQTTTASGMNTPYGLAYNSVSNTLYVADTGNSRILVFDVEVIEDGEDAVKVIGQDDFISSLNNGGIVSASNLSNAENVEYDGVNNVLYVGDNGNYRVLVFDLNNLPVTGATAIKVIGQTNFTDTISGVTQSNFGYIKDLTYNSVSNTLYVADVGGRRVLVFDLNDLPENSASAIAVIGQVDFESSVSQMTQAGFLYPKGLAHDPINNLLYVSDNDDFGRVLVFDLNNLFTTNTPAMAVIGQSSFVSYDECINGVVSRTDICGTYGVSYSSTSNTLYVVDGWENRVVSLNFISFSSDSTLPSGQANSQYSTTTLLTINSQGTVSFTVVSGTLPTGLEFNTSTGEIYGTPTVTGTFNFTIQARDTFADTSVLVNKKDFSLAVSEEVVVINPPTNFRATNVTADNITVSWDSANGSDPTEYFLLYGSIDGGLNFPAPTTVESTSSTIGMPANTSLYTKIYAVVGGVTSTEFATTTVYSLAATPAALTATRVSASSISLTINSDSNPSTTLYSIYNQTNSNYLAANGSANGATAIWQTTSSWGNNFAVTGLSCGTSYTFKIKAKNGDGVETDFSATAAASTNSCPSSGGGGGSTYTPPPSMPATEAPVIVSQTFSLDTPQAIKIGNVSHSVQLQKVNVDTGDVTFTIYSTPIVVSMKVGQEKVLDTDGDGINDVRIKLNSISAQNKSVDMSIVSIADLQFTINHFDINTNSRNVKLYFNSPDAVQMAISENADLSGASFVTYQTSKDWVLSDGYGMKKIYVKFRAAAGGTKIVNSSINFVSAQSMVTVAPVVVPTIVEDAVVTDATNPDSNIVITLPKKLQYAPNSNVYYTYQYTNTTDKTQKIKIVRQVLDAKNKVMHGASGTRVLKSEKSFKFNASSLLIKTLKNGDYTIKIKILDAKTNKVLDENGFNITVKKPAPVKVVKKVVVPVKKK